jgi:DNA-binding beta-propeller fold protein YncE
MFVTSRWSGRIIPATIACMLAILVACSGGSSITFNPAEETPTRIESSDGRIIAIIPVGALTVEATLKLENISEADAGIPGPEGRTLVMAMEFSAEAEPGSPPADTTPEEPTEGDATASQVSQAGDGAGDTPADPTTPTSEEDAAPTLESAVEITFLLSPALPPQMSIPIYTYNATADRYEDAAITATVSDDGSKLTFSLSDFGRYAFYSLLPEEIPPPAPTGLALIAASTQVRKFTWDASSGNAIAGYNLYRAPIGEDTAFAVANAEPIPLGTTIYVDELATPDGFDYYLTTVNSASLESEPGATITSPAVDFDLRTTFGSDRLVQPETLAASAEANLLLVADPGAQCVWVYNLSGHFQRRIDAYHTISFTEPSGLAFNPSGTRIYISDASAAHVYIYDTDFNEVGVFGTWGNGVGEFQRPTAVQVVYDSEVIGDVVLVVDETLSTLQSFTGLGVYLDTLATFGAEEGQLDSPTYMLAVGNGEWLYVSDDGNARVDRFDSAFVFDSAIELAVDNDGPLLNPLGLALDFRGRLYVADSGNQRVAVFDTAAEPLFHFGAEGDLRVEFNDITGPHGLALDPTTGYLYVSDTGNQRIVIFNS